MRKAGRSTLTPMALAVLEILHEGPRHPYEIHQLMHEREVWRLLKLTAGSLYHAIERLAEDGLIEVLETTRAGRRPERTTYRMTEAGQDAFAARLRSMIAEPVIEYPQYAVAVGFLHELRREDATFHLRRRTVALEAQLAADAVVIARLAEAGIHPLYWADVELKRCQRESELTWTRQLLDQITSGKVTWPHEGRDVNDTAGYENANTPPRLSLVDEGKQESIG
ncbi:MAG TPA: PadR family transcriptional regulator [Pseudonocardiaceae bacterium]|jgi:DNA-binding PadR family transcriptional regulator|nr:PadR family transcriptional regulator [Pseudonocardiaceae bacterium]